MLPFPPDPLYTPAELAAYNAINEVLAIVDLALGTAGNDPYVFGPVPIESPYEGERTELELEAISQMEAWKKRIENIETYQPATQETASPDPFAVFELHDPLDFSL